MNTEMKMFMAWCCAIAQRMLTDNGEVYFQSSILQTYYNEPVKTNFTLDEMYDMFASGVRPKPSPFGRYQVVGYV